ncbi:conserved hypothetical protein [Cellulomonas flavigena DSM 20109]|uniref:Uncharacterized protein n=2 Tax=Cellulomonas flavigena TaxID=1711 RepID=D5UBZ2_CELFN|nr:conserved hypothetical protein [Cellulomonas flavigena DSM 20109]
MDDEIELISDGEGLAVFGDSRAIDRFLGDMGLATSAAERTRVPRSFAKLSGIVQTTAEASAQSGRWVKLTEESAAQVKMLGLMKSKTTGLDMGIVRGSNGQIKSIVQFAKGPGAFAANPAMLAGAAGIMTQLAMQQAMDDISDYLAVIDAKIDQVLRAQKDAALADMIGVDLVIDDAMTIREHDDVDELTWSKVQGTAWVIARTQAYALLQLDGLAQKVEKARDVPRLAQVCENVPEEARDWLAVLAHCFRLQDALDVLELDRVLDGDPERITRRREALRVAREKRREQISRTTEQLLARLDAAAGTANDKVLRHPTKARVVVATRNDVTGDVTELYRRLGVTREMTPVDARRWVEAAADVRDRVVEAGSGSVEAAVQVGTQAAGLARSAGSQVADRTRDVGSTLAGRARSSAGVIRGAVARGRASTTSGESSDAGSAPE